MACVMSLMSLERREILSQAECMLAPQEGLSLCSYIVRILSFFFFFPTERIVWKSVVFKNI